MKKLDRRTMLKAAAGAVVGATFGRRGFAAVPKRSADLVLTGGNIITVCDKQPLAQAMAVSGGQVTAVGSDQEISQYVGGDTKVIPLAGRCVSPGLIDAHSHVIGFGQMQLKYVVVRPPKVKDFATLNRELAAAAKKTPPGEWIVARGFNTFAEGRFPRRWEIDEAVPNHPVLAIHWGGQFGVANTMAMKRANLLRADAKDPYGGKYLRDRSGVPDGVLLHYPAIYSVHQAVLDDREQLECAEWGLKQMAAQGITCVHDNFCNPRYARAYVWLERAGRLPCRVRVYPYVPTLEHCRRLVQKVQRYRGPLVRLQGVKLAVDGYALMYKVPAEHRHLAIPMHPQPRFEEIVKTIHNAGMQADVHAVGDKGVDWTLGAFMKAAGSAAECRRRRHRIEHFVFRKADSIRYAAALGVPVCIQPNFIEVRAEDMVAKMGIRPIHSMLPGRTFVKEGVRIAYGADVPAFPSHSPMDSIRSAMDRRTATGRRLDPGEAVSFTEALQHHTLGGAYAALDETEIGSLEPGKLADFVVWTGDLRRVGSGAAVAGLRPAATYLAGKAVYEAAS